MVPPGEGRRRGSVSRFGRNPQADSHGKQQSAGPSKRQPGRVGPGARMCDHFTVRVEATKLNVLLVFLPKVVMAAMHTTMISASMTAYSTAVGPSSDFRKFATH